MANASVYDDTHLLPSFRVKLDGTDLPSEIVDDVLEIVVEQSLHLPAACTIRLHDWDIEKRQFRWVDDARLKEGKQIEVLFGYQNNEESVFKGEVTTLEMDAAGHMVPNLLIHCLSKEHRLHRNRERKTYQEVKDSDIVQTVGSRLGLKVEADDTGTVRHWVCQNNQTDHEFVKMLADRNGCRAYVDGDTLHFKKVKDPEGVDHEVAWGDTLRSFRPRLTTHGMVDEVSVHGWDPKVKQAILSTKSSSDGKKSAKIGETKTGGEAASVFGSGKHAIINQPVDSQSEADSIAQSAIDKRETSFVEADGLCIGNTNIAAGKTVKVGGVGDRFAGNYQVTSATHTFTPAEGYTTQFNVSGKNPHTLAGMLSGDEHDQSKDGGYIVVGIVTDNKDPDGLGRIKVKYPWMMDEGSFWARMASPMAGSGRGIYYLPEIDDEVLIALEHGDIHRPYMIGALWNGKDNPVEPNSEAVEGGKVIHRVIKTRKGHIVMLQDKDSEEHVKITTQGQHFLILDDKDGGKKIQVQTVGGHYVLLDDQNKKIEVKTSGGHKLTMDDDGKKITLADSAGTETMTIDGNSGNIEFQCNGQFKVQAMQGIQLLTQMSIQATASSGVTIQSATTCSINAGASMSLVSSGSLAVTGSLVTIN